MMIAVETPVVAVPTHIDAEAVMPTGTSEEDSKSLVKGLTVKYGNGGVKTFQDLYEMVEQYGKLFTDQGPQEGTQLPLQSLKARLQGMLSKKSFSSTKGLLSNKLWDSEGDYWISDKQSLSQINVLLEACHDKPVVKCLLSEIRISNLLKGAKFKEVTYTP